MRHIEPLSEAESAPSLEAGPASPSFVRTRLSGWGRFPVEDALVYRPEKCSDVSRILRDGATGSYISRGLGRSYGDASLNRDRGVIAHTRLDRFLGFDPATGVLECEAGVSFADIIDTFLPRGFFLPVTPGTKFVSVGGAIAADVHGKNHHRDGTFGQHLENLSLLTGTGDILTCSATENADAFHATVGGMGLTGSILTARFRLRRVESGFVAVEHRRARNLEEALTLFDAADAHPYSVAWIDCMASGGSLGRSVLMFGDHAGRVEAPACPGRSAGKPKLRVPIDLPNVTLNRFSVRAFNAVYFRAHRDGATKIQSLDSFFYPLDALGGWNRLYGPRGFAQYQAVVPLENGETAIAELLSRISSSGRSSFLAVLKKFGRAGDGMLSFPFEGYTLALDLPAAPGVSDFLRELDEIVLRHEGRVYLAKDSSTTPKAFARMYPRLDEFRAVKRSLDPEGKYSSSQARRLAITP